MFVTGKAGDLIGRGLARTRRSGKDRFPTIWFRAPPVRYPSMESPPEIKHDRTMVFAPHQDDEVLGCGGTIARYISGGSRVRVVYMTDGRHGNPRFPVDEMIAVRKREALEGLKVLGCDDTIFMNYQDSALREDQRSVNRVLGILEDYRPDAIFLPYPLDNHPDHIVTAAIVRGALESYLDDMDCYCYEVWSAFIPNVLVDITEVAEKKQEAIRKHATQNELIDYADKIIGLNAFRSITAGRGVRHCEAFLKCSPQELIDLVDQARQGVDH